MRACKVGLHPFLGSTTREGVNMKDELDERFGSLFNILILTVSNSFPQSQQQLVIYGESTIYMALEVRILLLKLILVLKCNNILMFDRLT